MEEKAVDLIELLIKNWNCTIFEELKYEIISSKVTLQKNLDLDLYEVMYLNGRLIFFRIEGKGNLLNNIIVKHNGIFYCTRIDLESNYWSRLYLKLL